MAKSNRGSLIAVFTIAVTALLIGALGFIVWQNFLQPKADTASEQDESSQNAVDNDSEVERKTVTSTVKDWTVSLEAPTTWTVEEKEDKYYNYNTEEFEGGKKIILTHPSEKVSVYLQHIPIFSGDGTCNPSPIVQSAHEGLSDDRLSYIEAISEDGAFVMGVTNSSVASSFAEEADSCSFGTVSLVNSEGSVFSTNGTDKDVPYVRVTIKPEFADYSKNQSSWDSETVKNFLETQEYKEAKSIVKSLKI